MSPVISYLLGVATTPALCVVALLVSSVVRERREARALPSSDELDAFLRQAREDEARDAAATVRRWRETESSTPLPRRQA